MDYLHHFGPGGINEFETTMTYLPASPELLARIDELLANNEFQTYDTAAFNRMAREGLEFDLLATNGAPWFEIDTLEDLTEARTLFS